MASFHRSLNTSAPYMQKLPLLATLLDADSQLKAPFFFSRRFHAICVSSSSWRKSQPCCVHTSLSKERRPELMYPRSTDRLKPYEGIAPRMYLRAFDRIPPKSDEFGHYPAEDPQSSRPYFQESIDTQRVSIAESAAATAIDLSDE